MPASTNKSILITPGSYSSLSTSVSQIDLIWYTSGVGTFAYVPNSGDLRSTIYNWEQNSEPVILLGGIGTYNNQRKYVGPYQDFKGSFNGISSFPYLQFYPLSGEIKANSISVNGIASFSEIYSTGLSTFTYLNLTGSFYDQNFNPGQNGQILSSTGNGVAWTSITGAGIVSGKADANQITFWRNADSITGIDTFVFTNGNVGINTTNPLKKLHVRNSGILIDGTSGLDPAPYIARFIIDAAASVEHTLADFRNNNGSVFFVTGSRVAIGNTNVISNVFNVNGGDALINNLTIGLGSGLPNQPSSSTALGISALASNAIGIRNVAVGFQAGTANTSGNRNVFVGQLAGDSILSGSNNTFVGSDTDGLSTGDYQIAIGRSVVPTGSNQGAWGGVNNVTRTNLGIGTFTSLARLHVETLSASNMGLYIAGSPSQTADLVEINSTNNGQNYFTINGIGSVGVYTNLPTQSLDVNGNFRLRGQLYDGLNTSGVNNQILISTGTGVAWTSVSLTGIVTAFNGVPNRLAKFLDEDTIGNSSISDDGVIVSVGAGLSVLGLNTSYGFYGPGTFITNLNASNLTSGNVPSSVISGNYSGITSVGNLTQLNVLGIASVSALDLNGPIYDNLQSSGITGQILSSTGTGVAWSSLSSIGIITGNISQNQVAVGSASGSIVGFSTFTLDNIGLSIGTTVAEQKLTVGGNIKASGVISASQLISTAFAPTPPLVISSTSLVNNLNVQYWAGQNYPLTTTGDMLYSANDSGAAARIPPNQTTTIKVLTQVGNGTQASAPSWQVLPSAGFIQYFFSGLAATNAPFNFSLANDLPVGLGTTSASVNTGEVLVAQYITDPGVPNLEFLPAGNLSAYVWGNQSFGTSPIQLRVDFFETTSFGTSIAKIVSTNDSTALTSSIERYSLIGITTTTYNLANRNSRIQAKVYAVHGGLGLATANVFYGNGFDSLVQVVAPGADVTNFVPYNGAVYDVDLGIKNLQAGSIGLYTGFSTVSPLQGQFVWNSVSEQVELGLGNGFYVNLGFENALRIYNNTGSPLGIGSVIYVTGSVGGTPTVSLAQANTFQSGTVLGVVNRSIPTSSYGYVFTYGLVDYDTTAFTAGDNLYLSATSAGILTNIPPTAPNFSALVGSALNSSASGSIVVLQSSVNSLNEPNRILFANNAKFAQGISTFVYLGGNVGIGTALPTQRLHVQGGLRLTGGLYDTNNSLGSANQILISTGVGISWTSVTSTGIVTAFGGTSNRITKFLDEDTIGNSSITDDGAVVTVGVGMTVNSFVNSLGFYGPGTNITNLNASNLASGTVPSAVVSGNYSGITSVGNLTQLNVIGITTSTTFVGDGANLTSLNASNLTSGTVPSARISGSYSGITSVGNLTQLNVLGVTTSNGYFGPGTNLTNLNASNLTSGTVASARVSGAYSGITSVGNLTALNVTGFSTLTNVRVANSLYDGSFSPGNQNQVLISTGTGIAWTTTNATGIITGTGTVNTVPKFNTPNSLTNSNITDTGTSITLGSNASVSGILTSLGFFGPGTNLTNLNASNLIFGTVPSSVVSGSYSGITSVGNLTQLNVLGVTTSGGYFGPGTNITNLNASNLASGTVPSTVVSGTYSGITSVGTLTQLIVSGFSTINNIRVSGALYDNSFNPGTSNQVLISTGTGIAWTTSTATGIVTGTGTVNTVPKFNTPNSLTNSNITDNGIAVTVNSRLNVVGVGSFTNDLIVNQITVGQGGGQKATNTALGLSALTANTSGVQNTIIGYQAGIANTSGSNNVFIGNQVAQTNNAGGDNIAIGSLALTNNISGANNVAQGSEALRYYTATSNQTAIGYQALRGNSTTFLNTGDTNTAVGYQAGLANTSGSGNTFVGYLVGRANTTGQQNTFVGNAAGYRHTTGSYNNVFGSSALSAINTGNANQVFGYLALFVNTSGGNNHAFGNNSLESNTTASNNVAFGNQTLTRVTTNGNNVAVGFAALRYTTAANQVALGYQALQGSATTELNTGTQNTAVGYQAGLANTSGSRNTFVGYLVGTANTTGADNASFGNESLKANTTGSFNNAFGGTALRDNNTGQFNNAFGYQALLVNTSGSGNVAFGNTAMQANTTGSDNTAVGTTALVSNTAGTQNVAIGRQSLRYYDQSGHTAVGFAALQGNATVALNTGVQNVAVGYQAGTANTSGNNNTFVGYQAGYANTSGSQNSAIGLKALFSNLFGDNNTALGYQALYTNVSGSWNTAIGHNSLFGNTTGSNNAALGHGALGSNTTGSNNAAFGLNALASNTTASSNTGVGFAALRYVTTSSNNTAVGSSALQGSTTAALNTGTNNTALGASAGAATTSGSNNVFVGRSAGLANTSGSNNVFMGLSAGASMTIGSNNTLLGGGVDGAQGGDYQIALGQGVIPTASNFGAWGGATNATRTNLGVGTFSPLARIHAETLAAGNMGLYIAGSASQTAALLEVDATTNGSQYFVITGIGSVGIYTSIPTVAFDVAGDARLRGRLFDNSNSAGTNNQVLISTGTGISWTTATSTGIVTGTGAATQVAYWNSTNQITGNNLFVYNGIGSVGIGTIIPEYALHVVGTMAATIKSFIIEHPTKPGKKLRYASLEGPENGVYVRGRNSDPYIILPNYWVGLVDENTITVNITPVGSHQNLYVEKIEDYVVYVKYNSIFNKKLDYFYTVYGERKDVSKLEVEI